MKVDKFIKSRIERNYFFIKGTLDINCKYFIKEIEKGIRRSDNENFKTNLVSEMTNYKYFLNDIKLHESLMPISEMIDQNNLNEDLTWQLSDAWGYKHSFSHFTKKHNHIGGIVSGAIMLNEHSQTLYFPEINEKLKCHPGDFALFSPFLSHFTERTTSHKPRYGLSFNYLNINRN